MHFTVLDSGLVGRESHSYNFALAVRSAAKKMQASLQIFGSKRMHAHVKQDTGAIPAFRENLYSSIRRTDWPRAARALAAGNLKIKNLPLNESLSEALSFRKLNHSYFRDLRRLDASIWSGSVFVTGVCQNQLLGLVKHLLNIPERDRLRVVCHLMLGPNWTTWGRPSIHGTEFYREIFDRAKPLLGSHLKFAAETEEQAEFYKHIFGVDVHLVPLPLTVQRRAKRDRQRKRIGYFGYSKVAKGFHLLPEVVAACRQRGLNVDFLIQVQHSNWEPEVSRAEERLKLSPTVTLVNGVLSKDEYYSLFHEVDAVLLPYDPDEYHVRGSAIFAEAVSLGFPLVATAQTWPGRMISQNRAAGEVFSRLKAGEIANAIQRLLAKMPEKMTLADSLAGSSLEKHSAENFLKRIHDMRERNTRT